MARRSEPRAFCMMPDAAGLISCCQFLDDLPASAPSKGTGNEVRPTRDIASNSPELVHEASPERRRHARAGLMRTIHRNRARFAQTRFSIYPRNCSDGDGCGPGTDGYHWIRGGVDALACRGRTRRVDRYLTEGPSHGHK
jgi:hypothetical protein